MNTQKASKLTQQRLEQAKERISNKSKLKLKGWGIGGFGYRPQTDAELAMVLAQSGVMSSINKEFSLVDYNDQGEFDCLVWDEGQKKFWNVELEPELESWLGHNRTENVDAIIVWSIGKWKIGQKKSGKKGRIYKLVNNAQAQMFHFDLQMFASDTSKAPLKEIPVIELEQVYNEQAVDNP